MKKRVLALCLVLMMLWTLPVAAEGIDLSGLLSVFNVGREEGVIGRWQIMGVENSEDMDGSIESANADGSLVMLEIAEDTMTLSFIYPGKETSRNEGAITHGEGVIYSGSAVIPYVIDGDEMRMNKPEGTMILKRIGSGSPIGEWQLTGIQGTADAEELWGRFQQVGATVILVINGSQLHATIAAGGEVSTEGGAVIIDENCMTTALQLPYTVEGDTLTIHSGDVVLTLTRR